MDSFGYVLGVILGDGVASISRDYSQKRLKDGTIRKYPVNKHVVQLQCKDERFAEKFAYHLEVLTGKKPHIYKFTRKMSKSTLIGMSRDYVFTGFQVRLINKEWCFRFRNLKYNGQWKNFHCFSDDTIDAIIYGLLDSEGYRCEKYWDVANGDYDLLVTLEKMLKHRGIKSKIYSSPSQKIHHLRMNSKHFS